MPKALIFALVGTVFEITGNETRITAPCCLSVGYSSLPRTPKKERAFKFQALNPTGLLLRDLNKVTTMGIYSK